MNILWNNRAQWITVLVWLVCIPNAAFAQTTPAARRVEGIAYDSLAKRALSDAFVSIPSLGRSTTSDEKGRFRFDSVPDGAYEFQMQHAVFDSVGLSGTVAQILVQKNMRKVVLAVPSFQTMWGAACGSATAPKDSALFYGSVRSSLTQAPASHAMIEVSWVDLAGGGKSLGTIAQRRYRFTATADDRGEFALCGIPDGIPLTMRVAVDTTRPTVVDLPPITARVRRLDLLVAEAAGETEVVAVAQPADTVAMDSTTALRQSPAAGELRGTVTNANGVPIAGAIIAVDTLLEVRSGDDGQFHVRNIAPGTRQAFVVAIGLSPEVVTFNALPGETTSLIVPMSASQLLETVNVRANVNTIAGSRIRTFEEHRSVGLGNVYDSTTLVGHHSMVTVMRIVPGVTVATPRLGKVSISSPRCANMALYRDGTILTEEEFVTIDPKSIAGIEVYKRPLIYPSDIVSGGGCTVLIWTKRGFGGR